MPAAGNASEGPAALPSNICALHLLHVAHSGSNDSVLLWYVKGKNEGQHSGVIMMNTTIRALVIIMVFAFLALNASAEVYSWTHIPHVAAGSGYTSYLTLRDPHGTGSRWIFVYFNDDKGQKLSLADTN
jgi:hypothetical protein